MDISGFKNLSLFEHRFWLQILGDHSRFILDSLSAEESGEIEKASMFITAFDGLLDRARRDIGGADLLALTNQAYRSAADVRAFKLHLLKRHLTGRIKIHLSPTFINHMLNELDEYMVILSFLLKGQLPVFHPVHYHLLWLPDGMGHADGVADNLDEVEKELREKSRDFREKFCRLDQKAREMVGYMRTGTMSFPSLDRLNYEVEAAMAPFKKFLEELIRLRADNRVLGTLQPIMADHMAREECYYLTKLSGASNTALPECNPIKPRVE